MNKLPEEAAFSPQGVISGFEETAMNKDDKPRVHNKRAGTAPHDAVYIGRGSPWGNPFVIGQHGNRDDVCDRFEREVLPTLDVELLRGKHLVCFCKPARCHGDAILAKLEGSHEQG